LGSYITGKPQESNAESSTAGAASSAEKPAERPVRQQLNRLGSLAGWGFGGKNTETVPENPDNEEDDDRRIRFTIGGAGRRLTKDDFIREIQSLDPKARASIVEESNAPAAMKAMARKDASEDSPGSSRLLGARGTQMASGKDTAQTLGAEMARRRGASVSDVESDVSPGPQTSQRAKSTAHNVPSSSRRMSKVDSPSTAEPETAAERKRREKALRGIDDVPDTRRGRVRDRDDDGDAPEVPKITRRVPTEEGETAAERKRREAALGVGGEQDDSDDDDTPRVPPPAAQKSRGIRFAQSPVRGKR
jgi:hypothetical protein